MRVGVCVVALRVLRSDPAVLDPGVSGRNGGVRPCRSTRLQDDGGKVGFRRGGERRGNGAGGGEQAVDVVFGGCEGR